MSNSPTGRLRAAMLGTGAWARVLARAGKACEHLEIATCWGRTPDRTRVFAEEVAIPPAGDLDGILANRDIEAVVIALPNDRHREYAELAARNGKHVFVEKPIAHTLVDGVAMAALEKRYKVNVGVAHCARMLTGNRAIREAIASGELGRVSLIEARFTNDRGLKLTTQDWRWYQSGSPGGPLSQIAIHQFDTLRALGGDLKSVMAMSARRSPVGAEVEDQWIVNVMFADGKLGTVTTSWTSPGDYSVRATGDAGSMHYELDQSLWSQPDRLHENAQLVKHGRGGRPVGLSVKPGNMFRDELDAFALAVRAGLPGELSAENGCHALAAVDASILSAQRGGVAVELSDVLADACERAARQAPQPEAAALH